MPIPTWCRFWNYLMKNVKLAIIKMLWWTIIYILEANKKVGSITKEKEDIKKNQKEALDLKSKITQKLLGILNSKIKTREETISKIEDKTIESTQSGKQNEHKLKKKKKTKALDRCVTKSKDWTFISSEFQSKRRKNMELK